jgi:hypothetical protein
LEQQGAFGWQPAKQAVVSMTKQYILTERRNELEGIFQASFDDARLHSQAFSLRVLGFPLITENLGRDSFDFLTIVDSVVYGGFPDVAYLGFGIGVYTRNELSQQAVDAFVSGLERLQTRKGDRLIDFVSDDIAVLGVADGIAKLLTMHPDDVAPARDWLLTLLGKHLPGNVWSDRMRALAGDLLDDLGRLRAKVEGYDTDRLALELCLRASWPHAFRDSAYPDPQARNTLLKNLLVESAPPYGDLERAAVWLKALDLLIDETVDTLTPSISDTVRILDSTQHSFKRWVWDKKTRRGQVDPAHWLIDNEPHVQSFLWAVLYPIYGSDLVDETYLPGYGQVQPRFDLGIVSLRLIIEVKVMRGRGDFAEIEEQIAGDLGLYFKEPELFDRMVVYIYDDSDKQYSERYGALKNALKQRERIEDVVIVRRPSMIPPRDQRKSTRHSSM